MRMETRLWTYSIGSYELSGVLSPPCIHRPRHKEAIDGIEPRKRC